MRIFFFGLSLLISCVVAAKHDVEIYHEGLLQYYTCRAIIPRTVFYFRTPLRDLTYIPPDGGFCNKNRQQALGSMVHCLKRFPRERGIPAFLSACQQNLSIQDIDAAFENATRFLVNVTNIPGFNSTQEFFLPVAINQNSLDAAYRATLGRFHNDNRGNIYGAVLVSYWILLILLAGIIRVITAAAPQFVHSFNGRVSNAFRRYLTLAPLGRKKVMAHGRVWKIMEFMIPTRTETVYLIGWFAMVVGFNTSDYRHDAPNVFWPNKDQELSRKVANRTGRIILYLIPQVVLFAGRNNIFQWISGWRFARFNTIHRWMARGTLLLMITHAVCMTVYIQKARFVAAKGRPSIRMGYVAIVAAGIMCFHSLRKLRKDFYELFVLTHNVLGILFIAAVWVHVQEEGLAEFMYAATAIWGFDKFLRLVRIARFGVRTADVALLPDDVLRVTIPRSSAWKPYSLSYAYIYFLKPTYFWQSHPFTVMNYALEDGKLAFYIKVKGGLSCSLLRYLNSQPEKTAQIKCTVEGPYGAGVSLKAYKSISFLSTGTGIASLYSSAVSLAKKDTVQRLKLYWVIRNWDSIGWFYEELKTLEGTGIDAVIYITRYHTLLGRPFTEKAEVSGGSTDSKSEDCGENQEEPKVPYSDMIAKLKQELCFIDFRAGRPDMAGIVQTDIQEASGSIAFLACGHSDFVDSARQSVRMNLEDGKRVGFHDCMEMW